MTLTKWREQMMENVLHDSDHDEKSSTRKTITTSGDIRSSLNDRNVYSVRKISVCKNIVDTRVYLSSFLQTATLSKPK